MFDAVVEVAFFGGGAEVPPGEFGDANAVFAGDFAVPGDDLFEDDVGHFFAGGSLFWEMGVYHDVGVDVAVASVTKAGYGKAVLFL